MTQEIAVVAVAQAKPGAEAEVAAVIAPCATATRHEAGCRLYSVHTDLDRPGRFVFIERWASRDALAAHEKEAHFLAMAAAFETRLAEPLQVMILRELA